jgi:hypothetical protein
MNGKILGNLIACAVLAAVPMALSTAASACI